MIRGPLHSGLLLSLCLTGCTGRQSVLAPAADQAAHIKDIWSLLLWSCGVLYVLVMIFLGAALWRTRHSIGAAPVAEAQNTAAELALGVGLRGWGAVIVLGIMGLSVGSFLTDRKLGLASTDDALHIKVTGNQWWWKVEYQDPVASQQFITANEFHLPIGRPVMIELNADDVIHSFWIPNLAGKQDMIPARTTHLVIHPRRAGTYRAQCAEFCGLDHALMSFDATVENADAFAAWRAAQVAPAREPVTATELHGKDVFMKNACLGCHQIVGTEAAGQTGPDLTHFASRPAIAAGVLPMSHGNLIAWLDDPQKIKPGNHMPVVHLTGQDREDLATYLESLK